MMHERQQIKKIDAIIDTYDKVLKTWHLRETKKDKWDMGYNAGTENMINELKQILRSEPC